MQPYYDHLYIFVLRKPLNSKGINWQFDITYINEICDNFTDKRPKCKAMSREPERVVDPVSTAGSNYWDVVRHYAFDTRP